MFPFSTLRHYGGKKTSQLCKKKCFLVFKLTWIGPLGTPLVRVYMSYEGSNSANQNNRKLGISNRKLEGSRPLNIVIFIMVMIKKG